MAKASRLRQDYRQNASKMHIQVGDFLRETFGQALRIYQEYPVNRINPTYSDGRQRFDWVLLDHKIVIEVHGEQHYKPVTFGGITEEEALVKFQDQRKRDEAKKQAALQAGFAYIVFRYDDQITEELLFQKISNAARANQPMPELSPKKSSWRQQKRVETPEQKELRLAKAKEYRKRRYAEQRERQKQTRRKNGD